VKAHSLIWAFEEGSCFVEPAQGGVGFHESSVISAKEYCHVLHRFDNTARHCGFADQDCPCLFQWSTEEGRRNLHGNVSVAIRDFVNSQVKQLSKIKFEANGCERMMATV